MQTKDSAYAMEYLLSHREIYNLLCDYMHAQDRLDPAMHASVFHSDATLDYGTLKGGPADFVPWAQNALSQMKATHHLIGQARIDIEGDVAFGEVYFQAFHLIEKDAKDIDLFISGRYVDRYERRDGTWKIAHRTEIVDWESARPSTESILSQLVAETNWGRRGNSDLSRNRDLIRKL